MVIRFSALGDVAMTVPVINALRRSHPETKITFLTRKAFVPVLEQIPGITVMGIDLNEDYKGLRGLWKLAKELKQKDFDAIADLHNVLRTKILKSFIKSSGIPFKQLNKGRTEKKALTAKKAKVFEQLTITIERYAQVFRELGFECEVNGTEYLPKLKSSAFPQSWVNGGDEKLVGIAPFAAHPAKQYSLEKMEEVISMLDGHPQIKIFLFGSPKEGKILAKWASKFKNTINVAGEIDFKDELALISQLDLMVSMDSANGHLASLYGIPVITLWGVTHPYAGFAPFGQPLSNSLLADRDKYPAVPTSIYGNKHPSGYEKAINTIKPADVAKKVKELLGN